MALDATGTPTSPDNIPTLNTSVDAPSGNGFNAAMAQIQAIVTGLKAGTLGSGKIAPAGISWTGAYPFKNADVDAAAALAVSKLAPGTNGQVITTIGGVPAWSTGSSSTLRKNTATAVNTTVAATDLLAAGITIGAGTFSATSVLRFKAWGDWLNNSGGTAIPPRFQLKLGATTLFDTGAAAGAIVNNVATRGSWMFSMTLDALNATNSQTAECLFWLTHPNWGGTNNAPANTFTTGQGNSNNLSIINSIGNWQGSAFNTSAVDMTVGQALVLNTINASASALYETKCSGALVEII